MVSKNEIKLIKNLNQKKYRNANNLFVVEGEKGVLEFLNSNFEVHSLFCTLAFNAKNNIKNVQIVSDATLKKISSLKSPNKVVAVFNKPKQKSVAKTGVILVLDKINDPGNLGTIIRLCDWFRVTQIICSNDTVDCYNPKVVQASMGSLARVNIIYTNVIKFLKTTKLPIFASAMDGKSIYETNVPKQGVLIMGNEANGISKEILNLDVKKLAIPRFNDNRKPESLNVATATAIFLSEFNR